MAMMAKMRSLAPAFIVTVGALFVLFMVVSDSNVLEALGGRTNVIGSVNGEDITYTEFAELLEQQRESQRAQTGRDIEDEQMDQFRNQVWDALVTQKLIEQQIEEFGITVSEDEIRNIILGENPPPFLKQQFTDSLGNFNRSLYEQAMFDPRNREGLIQAEEYVRQQRLQEKFQSLLFATVTVSEAEVKRKFIEQNTSINAQYALVDINQMPDSVVTVSDDELKEYYNENIDKYKIEAQRKLKYVLFSRAASAEDSAFVKRTLQEIVSNFKKDTVSFEETVGMYSAFEFSKDTLIPTRMPADVIDLMIKASEGDVIGPVATPQGMVVYHYLGAVPAGETYVKASHILINQFGSDEKNLEEANKVYNQIAGGASFEQLARERSASPEGQTNGGNLGWFGKGMMVPEFESAALNGQVGVLQKPVKTSYGYHIIKTTGKTTNKFIVEWVTAPIKPSASTIDAKYNDAADFAYVANDRGFDEEAKSYNYQIQESPAFVKESFVVPGLGQNQRLVQFAFENSLNTVSERPFTVPAGYVVAKVSDVISEGVKPFDEVKEQIKPQVIRQKKFEKAAQIIESVKKKVNGNLAEAPGAAKYVVYNQTGSFTPGGNVPTVGRDYAFIEKALDLKLNQVSEPLKGQRGYYLIKVTERKDFDSSAYNVQRNMILNSILQEKKNTYFNQWITTMKEEADIEDNRYVFYGQ